MESTLHWFYSVIQSALWLENDLKIYGMKLLRIWTTLQNGWHHFSCPILGK